MYFDGFVGNNVQGHLFFVLSHRSIVLQLQNIIDGGLNGMCLLNISIHLPQTFSIMAQQDGIIPIKGTIDKLSFYKSKDGYMARKKTSLTAQKMATDPKFARTRETMQEFATAGAAGKLLRTALRPLSENASDHRHVSRLVKQMVAVIQADKTSARGKRNVIDGEAELLTGFEFNINGKLSATFFAPYEATIDRATGQLQVKVPPFVPQSMVSAPAGATHFQVHIAALEVDFVNGKFVVDIKRTDHLGWGVTESSELTLAATVPVNSTHPLFLAMAVSFSIETNGVQYALKSGAFNALAIVKVSGV